MADHKTWHLTATTKLAQDVHAAMMRDPFSTARVWFKPFGLAFTFTLHDEAPPDGYQPITTEKVPGDRTLAQLTSWLMARTSRVDVLPKG